MRKVFPLFFAALTLFYATVPAIADTETVDIIEYISARATKVIIENTGNSPFEGIEKCRAKDCEPEIIVKFRNLAEPRVYEYDERKKLEDDTYGYSPQYFFDANNTDIGKHTAYVNLLGHTAAFEFEVVETPIAELTVTAENPLYIQEKTDGTKYCDFSSTVFSVKAKFKDGRTERYPYVCQNDIALYDRTGYKLSIKAENAENLTPGKCKAEAIFMGKKAEFDLEICEFPYTDVMLVGDEALIIYLIGKGINEKHVVKSIITGNEGSGNLTGVIVTDRSVFGNVLISWKNEIIGNSYAKEYYGVNFGIELCGLKSNVQQSQWFEEYKKFQSVSAVYSRMANGKSPYIGRVTPENLDIALAMAAQADINFETQKRFEGKFFSDENGSWYRVSPAEAEELLQDTFIFPSHIVDVKSAVGYDAASNIINIPFVSRETIGIDSMLYDYETKKWIYRTDGGLIAVERPGMNDMTIAYSGDINLDGSIDVTDLIKLKKLTVKTPIANDFGDINGDGYLNSLDISLLRKLLLCPNEPLI